MRLCPRSLALASSIPVLGLERFCPRKGCPWPRIFFVSLALSLMSSTPPLQMIFLNRPNYNIYLNITGRILIYCTYCRNNFRRRIELQPSLDLSQAKNYLCHWKSEETLSLYAASSSFKNLLFSRSLSPNK